MCLSLKLIILCQWIISIFFFFYFNPCPSISHNYFGAYLQRLHSSEVSAVVVGAQHHVLLRDPRDGLVCVAVEALDLVRAEQALLAHQRHLAEALPGLVQLL